MPFSAVLKLLLLSLLWGTSFVLIKLSTDDFGATAAMFLRVSFGFLFIALFVSWRNITLLSPKLLLLTLGIGVLNSALPFTFLAYASQQVSSGLLSITNASTVFFTLLIARIWIKESITPWQLFGCIVGMSGIICLFWNSLAENSTNHPMGIVLSILACFSYGIAITASRKYLKHIPARLLCGVSLSGASLFLMPLALINWPTHPILAEHWIAPLLIGIFATGIAYFIYFNLISTVGAGKTAVVTMLVPFTGVLFGSIILDETLTLNTFIGGALILLGATFVLQLNHGIQWKNPVN